jgi:hypothetical protein
MRFRGLHCLCSRSSHANVSGSSRSSSSSPGKVKTSLTACSADSLLALDYPDTNLRSDGDVSSGGKVRRSEQGLALTDHISCSAHHFFVRSLGCLTQRHSWIAQVRHNVDKLSRRDQSRVTLHRPVEQLFVSARRAVGDATCELIYSAAPVAAPRHEWCVPPTWAAADDVPLEIRSGFVPSGRSTSVQTRRARDEEDCEKADTG